MRAEIKALHQRLKTTTVYVTHDQVEAMTMADRIVVMHDGRIEQIGTPLELYDHPDNLFVAQFIGSPAMNVVNGTVKRSNGAAHVDMGDGVRWPLQQGPGADGQAVAYGVRPGDLALAERIGAERGGRRSHRRRADRRRDGIADPGRRGAADPRHARPARRESRRSRRPRGQSGQGASCSTRAPARGSPREPRSTYRGRRTVGHLPRERRVDPTFTLIQFTRLKRPAMSKQTPPKKRALRSRTGSAATTATRSCIARG